MAFKCIDSGKDHYSYNAGYDDMEEREVMQDSYIEQMSEHNEIITSNGENNVDPNLSIVNLFIRANANEEFHGIANNLNSNVITVKEEPISEEDVIDRKEENDESDCIKSSIQVSCIWSENDVNSGQDISENDSFKIKDEDISCDQDIQNFEGHSNTVENSLYNMASEGNKQGKISERCKESKDRSKSSKCSIADSSKIEKSGKMAKSSTKNVRSEQASKLTSRSGNTRKELNQKVTPKKKVKAKTIKIKLYKNAATRIETMENLKVMPKKQVRKQKTSQTKKNGQVEKTNKVKIKPQKTPERKKNNIVNSQLINQDKVGNKGSSNETTAGLLVMKQECNEDNVVPESDVGWNTMESLIGSVQVKVEVVDIGYALASQECQISNKAKSKTKSQNQSTKSLNKKSPKNSKKNICKSVSSDKNNTDTANANRRKQDKPKQIRTPKSVSSLEHLDPFHKMYPGLLNKVPWSKVVEIEDKRELKKTTSFDVGCTASSDSCTALLNEATLDLSQSEDYELYMCDLCGFTCKTVASLQSHKRKIHELDILMCCICEGCFQSKEELTDHIENSHMVNGLYKCDDCSKSFKVIHSLQAHIKAHKFNQSYKCKICGKLLYSKAYLDLHLKRHEGIKPHECSVCSMKFSQLHSLKRHLQSHSDDKKFQCDECNQSFTLRETLKQHKRIHSDERPFACKLCNKRFKQRAALCKHRVVHSDLLPFKCEECGKCFRYKFVLQRHLVSHTGEKKFKCPDCDKSFALLTTLKQHQITHSGSRDFECNICGNSFGRKQILKTHLSRVHGLKT